MPWAALLSFETGLILLFATALIGGVLFFAAAYSGLLRKPQNVDPSGTQVAIAQSAETPARTLHLPGAAFVDNMSGYIERRQQVLSHSIRGTPGQSFLAAWSALDETQRMSTLTSQASEVSLAVSQYVGGDEALLHALCPELVQSSLATLAQSPRTMLDLMRTLSDGKLPLSPSKAASAELERIASAVSIHLDGSGKAERRSRLGFVPRFRRLCLIAFCIAIAENVGPEAEVMI